MRVSRNVRPKSRSMRKEGKRLPKARIAVGSSYTNPGMRARVELVCSRTRISSKYST